MPEEKRWNLLPKIEVPEDFQAAIGGDPLVAETLYRRGYQTLDAAGAFLNPDAYQPTQPEQLPDCDIACKLLIDALDAQGHILVWGDFDVDGQTATTILVEGLRELGGRVSYHIPIRAKESHGITRKVLETYLKRGFDLFLTCDTGISEHENIQHLLNAGLPVIVTDHHTLGETLPPANAVVNPQRLPPAHPLRTLPGVGVAYKLIEGLFTTLERPFDSGHYQELAALGIVADVAELHGDTRYLLQKGLAHLRHTQRLGLQTLYRNASLNPLNLNEDHIGFQIAPRLNAVGRLGDANPMVEFLTTQDEGRARVLATQIEAMNAKRRFMTRQVEKAAESQLGASPDDRHAPAIVLHHPEWPGGVVGIVASRLVERYQKPVILLTGSDPMRGSARSVDGIHITEAIASQKDLLISFGGHPMAAGLALPSQNLTGFKRGFQDAIARRAEEVSVRAELEIHQTLALDQISLDLIAQIQRLAPFGPGNPTLNFLLENLNLVSERSVGGEGEHRQVVVEDNQGVSQSIIWWNGGDQPLPEAAFDLVCALSQSDYRGSPQISARWIDWRYSKGGRETIAQRHFSVVDLRHVPKSFDALQQFLGQNPQASVWAEGDLPDGLAGLGRHELGRVDKLVIWSTPPSQSVLDDVIRETKPKEIVVFAVNPGPSSVKGFHERLAGLAKYVVHHRQGKTTIAQLASACAVEDEAIWVGLKLWEARGKLKVDCDLDSIRIQMDESPPDPSAIEVYQTILDAVIEECMVYRNYFKKGDLGRYLMAGLS